MGLIPAELTANDSENQLYLLNDGAIVVFNYLATWNNSFGKHDEELDRVCRDLFDMEFAKVESAWYSRLKCLSGWWHKVRMKKVENAPGSEKS